MLALLSSLSLAADHDLAMDLKVVDPLGHALVDESVALPYEQHFPMTLGKTDYVVFVEAKHEGRKAEVLVHVFKGDPVDEVEIATPSLLLNPDERREKTSTTSAPRGVKDDGGTKLKLLDWSVEAEWGWAGRDWMTDTRTSKLDKNQVVLVWAGAPLLRSSDDASPVRMQAALREPGVDLMPVEVIEDGDLLHVRTLGSPGGACHALPNNGLDGYVLDLWVAKEDLALVVPRTFEVTYSDETSTTVDAGVAIYPLDGKTRIADSELVVRADTGDFLFDAALPKGSVGLGYGLSEARPPVESEQVVQPTSSGGVGVTLAGPVKIPGYDSSRIGQAFRIGEIYEFEGMERTGAVVKTNCSAHLVTVQPARIKPLADDTILVGLGAERPTVESGTIPVYWPDGSVAGTGPAPEDLEFSKRETRACKEIVLDTTPMPVIDGITYEPEADNILSLCWDKADL
ncbi:MAG TPA: hypothetical protein QGF58_07335 [Myxococcota bacterium]|nr:hypothetical protein [Myxococcota bacterium]